jgi:hypothetical protein
VPLVCLDLWEQWTRSTLKLMVEAHWHTQNEPPFVDLPSTTGINRLPMDLLTRIFALILREYHEDPEPHYTNMDRVRAPFVYTHVCGRWRAIAHCGKSP